MMTEAAERKCRGAGPSRDLYVRGHGGLRVMPWRRWFRKAADQGHAKAQCNLGFMYLSGHGLPQSDALAVEWYRKAADQGHAPAQCSLGPCTPRAGWLASGLDGGASVAPQSTRRLRAAAERSKSAAGATPTAGSGRSSIATSSSSSRPPHRPLPLFPSYSRAFVWSQRARAERAAGRRYRFVAASGRLKVNLEDGRGPFSLLPKNLHEELD